MLRTLAKSIDRVSARLYGVSAAAVVLVVRTPRPFYRDKPSRLLFWATLSVMAAAVLVPFTPLAGLFGLQGFQRRKERLPGDFFEIYCRCGIATCEQRDPKGLYHRAIAGEIKNFTGIDQPYETPENPELHLLAGVKEPDRLANEVIDALIERKVLSRS